MFGLLQRKRKEIRITCPACRAEQAEPALAISSFCRACGAHFRIEKGVAIMPPGARYSGIVERHWDEPEPETPRITLGVEAAPVTEPTITGARGVGETWMREESGESPPEEASAAEPPTSREKGGKKRRGRRRGKKSQPARKPEVKEGHTVEEPVAAVTPVEEASPTSEAILGRHAQPVETLKKGSMGAMLGGSLEAVAVPEPDEFRPKMPAGFLPGAARRKPAPETRLVRCFECNHQQSVSLAASSTQCARCSVYISLADHEIASAWSQNIRTRGDVWIKKRGSVTGCDVACHHLEIDGRISASVDCSGVAHFRHSGRVMGHMHCQRLVVERKCEVIFPQGVWAESVDVYGTVVGNITCAGTIRIMKHGRVEGDARARAVDLKDGGELSGRMSIQSDLDVTPPEKQSTVRLL